MGNEENSIDLFFDKVETSKKTNAYMDKAETVASKLNSKKYDVALIGVSEASKPKGGFVADAIRKGLYPLKGGFKNIKIADLGNIKIGQKKGNSFYGLQCVVEQLTAKGIVCIVMGDDQRLTAALVNGLGNNKQDLVLSVLDSRLDLGLKLNTPSKVDAQNYLLPLTIHPAISFCNILGYQQYYCSDAQINYMQQKNSLETEHRLGMLRNNLFKIEPTLRDTDILSIDMNVIRQADAPAATMPSPNGLMGEEACQLMRYAGTSDKISVVGLFGMECQYDQRNQTAELAAQMIWHLLEGLDNRVADYPEFKNCKQMIIPGDKEMELHFLFSPKLNRWWVEVPTQKGKKLMACQSTDYENAKKGETPSVWFRHFMK